MRSARRWTGQPHRVNAKPTSAATARGSGPLRGSDKDIPVIHCTSTSANGRVLLRRTTYRAQMSRRQRRHLDRPNEHRPKSVPMSFSNSRASCPNSQRAPLQHGSPSAIVPKSEARASFVVSNRRGAVYAQDVGSGWKTSKANSGSAYFRLGVRAKMRKFSDGIAWTRARYHSRHSEQVVPIFIGRGAPEHAFRCPDAEFVPMSTLRTGAAPPDPPYEPLTKDGPAGFDIALMQRIAERLGPHMATGPLRGLRTHLAPDRPRAVAPHLCRARARRCCAVPRRGRLTSNPVHD